MTDHDWAAAVLADPGNPGLRLALSDWMEERGRAAEAVALRRKGSWNIFNSLLFGNLVPGAAAVFWDSHDERPPELVVIGFLSKSEWPQCPEKHPLGNGPCWRKVARQFRGTWRCLDCHDSHVWETAHREGWSPRLWREQ